jgi:hypothetical protein
MTSGRRQFLRAVGGAMLGVPLLPSLMRQTARAEVAPPLRFVFMGGSFGRDLRKWYPADEPTERSPDGGVHFKRLRDIQGPLSYILDGAFDPFRDKLNIVRGLDCMQRGNAHSPTLALTASGGLSNGPGFGCSFDSVLEESPLFYPELPQLAALRTCPNAGPFRLSFSYSAKVKPGQRQWCEKDPKVVYDRYFNPATVAQSNIDGAYKRGVVNEVMEDYRRVMGHQRISSSDRGKLDNYMTLLADAERKLGITRTTCSAASVPAAVTSAEQLHSAMMDLEVAALACGQTKIVCHTVLHWQTDPVYMDEPAHGDAHNHVGPSLRGELTDHAKHNHFSMARVAEMLGKLDAVDEGNGTLLDNTLFLYGNTESRGFHTQLDMPVLIGGATRALQTGYYLDYRPRPALVLSPSMEVDAGRPYNHLLTSAFTALGIPPQQYQRFGKRGFGEYRGFDPKLEAHYAPFLSDLDAKLPMLLR